jgi:signal transduction histidine kinase
MLIPRLGDYLRDRALVSEEDLQRALAYQQAQIDGGKPCLLGQALVQLEIIDRVTLDEAITEQILQLRSALEAANRNLEQRVDERTAELQEALRRLSELGVLKANFISNISHELRTPLTHIVGYLELFANGSLGDLTPEQQRAAEVSRRSASRLESLVEDLIMFATSSRGELSLKLEPADIGGLISTAVKAAAPKGKDRGVTLRAEVGESLPPVQLDADKMRWALSQLLDNGVKFTPSGGEVVVSAKAEGGNLVAVAVSDTGIGIPAERLPEIFEPFHQLDGSTTRRYGGTGLGLSLVRQIIEAHGSMLDVKSVDGKGTVFKFPLLAVRDQA